MPRGHYIRGSRPRKSPIELLLRHIEVQPNGCWWWTRAINKKGYGDCGFRGSIWRAHRVSFTIHKGEIPAGLDLDHICHKPSECPGGVTCPHRRCVNPDHLEPVTRGDNNGKERSCNNCGCGVEEAAKKRRARTHCKRGHEFTPENTYTRNSMRTCLTCKRERKKEKRRLSGIKPRRLGLS